MKQAFRECGGRSGAGAVICRAARVALAMTLTVTPAIATEHFIDMFAGAFLPQSVQVQVGDTVTWVWVAGTHQLASGFPGGAPGTIDEPGTLFAAPVDAANPSFSYLFTTPSQTVSFHDALSPLQVGFVQVLGDDLTFEVVVLDNVFEPELVELFVGDSVRWEHEPGEMVHSITSGLSSAPADDPGALFDEVSSDQQPVFVFTFATAGEVPYFCLPHESLGMAGLIRVQAKFRRGDANGDQDLTIADPITTLGVLFQGQAAEPCEDAADANDDGQVDIGDVIWSLSYLFASGPAPPPPFPVEGPDRTGDGLICAP